ncbi:MAG: hypothetical protein SOX77_01745 [Candidatus Borkfalkiaceae bacterium]|nr:hypothetical protein [Christensenellaceae bacterium]
MNDEIDYTFKFYKSIAVRINEEDFILDDAFYHSFFKKNIE